MKLENIKYSVLDLAGVIEGQSVLQSFKNSMELAQYAEKLGYTRYWLAEHHNMPNIASSATSVLMGYIAGGTQKIRVGSGGVMLPNHSSLVIAEQFGTLETLYPGRIDLGVGRAPGTDQITAQALGRNPLTINEHFPRQIKELQTYFSSENRESKVRAFPGEGLNIPIYMLGSSTDSAWLAAEMGLPYAFAAHFAPDYMKAAFSIYEDNFTPKGGLQTPYKMMGVNVIAADSDEEAEYLATTLFQTFVNLIRNERKPYQPPVEDMDAIWSPMEAAYVSQKLSHTLIGSRETIRKQLEGLWEIYHFDEIIAVCHVYEHRKRLETYKILKEAITSTF